MKNKYAKKSNWVLNIKIGPENAPCPLGEAAQSNDVQPDYNKMENAAQKRKPTKLDNKYDNKGPVHIIQYSSKPVPQQQSMAEAYMKFWARDIYHADEESGKPIGTIF